MSANTYEERVQSQIAQYRDVPNIHDLPDIFHYWSVNYLRPKAQLVFGVTEGPEIFAYGLSNKLGGTTGPFQFASLGAGDCSVELATARKLLDRGVSDFVIDCYELSPGLLGRAEVAIRDADLAQHFGLIECDINTQSFEKKYHGVMAHQSLHHFVQLERIFDNVKEALHPGASFVINDTIGRNGHMRWPESLDVVKKFWATLPPSKRYHYELKTFWPEFQDFDCSTEGFEGIRAQDILPLLVGRFHFSHFIASGGVADIFTSRGIGHNFDVNNEADRSFIDLIEYVNRRLMDCGVIKPTWMFGIAQNEPCDCRHETMLTPEFCVRLPTPIGLFAG